jgi:hypothetical protein
MNHQEARELLTLAAAGTLDTREQQRLQEHLSECDHCRVELDGWMLLAGSLRELPTPQAPAHLILQTRRLLEIRIAAIREESCNRSIITLLVLFSWTATLFNWPIVRLLGNRITGLFGIPPDGLTTFWVIYLVLAWLAIALLAGLLGKHSQQEGKAT